MMYMIYMYILDILALDLEPIKMDICLRRVDKGWSGFLVTSWCLLFRKVWWAVRIGSFCPPNRLLLAKNWGVLQIRMDQNGDHMKMNFTYFQIQKWMFQTVRMKKVDENNTFICLVSMFASWVMVLKLFRKVHFLQSCANRSPLKQFTYINLKGIVTPFQKTILFIMLWINVSEILGFEGKHFC